MRSLFTFAFISTVASLLLGFELEIETSIGSLYSPAKGKVVYQKESWKDSYGAIDQQYNPNFYGWIECKSDNTLLPKFAFSFIDSRTEGESLIHIVSASDLLNDIITTLDQKLPITINDTDYASRLSMQTYDFLLYYEFFEKSVWPSIGIGLDLKKFDFDYAVTIIDGLEFNDHGDGLVPMLYLKTRWDIKSNKKNRLSLQLDGKQYVTGPSKIYDYSAKLDMMIRYNDDTMLGVEMGYRASYFNIRGSDIDKVGGEMDTSGVFVGFRGSFK